MLSTLSIAHLENLLSAFSVPMFATERQARGNALSIVCVNTAFESLAQRRRDMLVGQQVSVLSGDDTSGEMQAQYDTCIRERKTLHCTFRNGQGPNAVTWAQTLQYAQTPEGHDRVITSAISIPCDKPLLQDKLAFDDVRYFSYIADLQIENLSNAFSDATQHVRVSPAEEERMMRLHAVCRTIKRTVSDIKEVVRAAQLRHGHDTMQSDDQAGAQETSAPSNGAGGMDTIRAIANAS
ncbi:MAG: hypothetical protein AAF307_03440 [Pseudomonadota bacterium]